uniref:SH2 domain-containing protein n=1 Tax=Macrostomum lignano TaxID=282301 RepID=A0A1I8IRV6_9PLAT
ASSRRMGGCVSRQSGECDGAVDFDCAPMPQPLAASGQASSNRLNSEPELHQRLEQQIALFRQSNSSQQLDPVWWYVEHRTTRSCGYAPVDLLAKGNSLDSKCWFAGPLARKEAERLLLSAENPSGTFMIRESSTVHASYSLSVLDKPLDGQDTVKHYRIRQLDNCAGFFITRKAQFSSMQELVEYYSCQDDALRRSAQVIPVRKLSILDAGADRWSIDVGDGNPVSGRYLDVDRLDFHVRCGRGLRGRAEGQLVSDEKQQTSTAAVAAVFAHGDVPVDLWQLRAVGELRFLDSCNVDIAVGEAFGQLGQFGGDSVGVPLEKTEAVGKFSVAGDLVLQGDARRSCRRGGSSLGARCANWAVPRAASRGIRGVAIKAGAALVVSGAAGVALDKRDAAANGGRAFSTVAALGVAWIVQISVGSGISLSAGKSRAAEDGVCAWKLDRLLPMQRAEPAGGATIPRDVAAVAGAVAGQSATFGSATVPKAREGRWVEDHDLGALVLKPGRRDEAAPLTAPE